MKTSKRIIAFFIAIAMIGMITFQGSTVLTAHATDKDKEYQKTVEKVMNMPVETDKIAGWPTGPQTHGEAAIVMEVGTGAILYAKNIDKQYFPASITKLLTALVAFENSELTDEVRITDDCVDFLNFDDAWIGLKAGNTITMDDAMHAMLMASANEASYAIAMNVGEANGEDYDWFISQMNKKMKELGGENSHFVNANGLHDENHYTCARDMALVGRELFKYPEFFRIAQTQEYKIERTKNVEEHVFQQYHKMLLPYEEDYYPYAIGGKLGYTDQALSTLVTMTDKNDMQLVTVVLKTYGVNIYPDTTNLCEYAYGNFEKKPVSELELPKDVAGFVEDDEHPQYLVLPIGADESLLEVELEPIDPNIEASTEAIATYRYNGYEVGTVRVQLSDRYVAIHKKTTEENAPTTVIETAPEGEETYIHKIGQMFQPMVTFIMEHKNVQIVLFVAVILFLLVYLLLGFRAWRRKRILAKRKKERMRRKKMLKQQQMRQQQEQEEALRKYRKELIIRMRHAGYTDDEIRQELAREKQRLQDEKTRVFP